MSVRKTILLAALLLCGCPRQVPEGPRGIDTVVLNYQTPEQRQAVQTALEGLGIAYKLNFSAGGQAEYAVELDEADLANKLDALRSQLPAYTILRRQQRLQLICCK